MPPHGFTCTQCGHCCLNLGAHNADCEVEDLKRWVQEKREDILSYVEVIRNAEGLIVAIDIWISPRTGEMVTRCPWLRKIPKQDKYRCLIHDTKPKMCREYPVTTELAQETGCKGIPVKHTK